MEFFDLALLFGFYKIIPEASKKNMGKNWNQVADKIAGWKADYRDGTIDLATLNRYIAPLNIGGVDILQLVKMTQSRAGKTHANELRSAADQKDFLLKIDQLLTDPTNKGSTVFKEYGIMAENMLQQLKRENLKRFKGSRPQ